MSQIAQFPLVYWKRIVTDGVSRDYDVHGMRVS